MELSPWETSNRSVIEEATSVLWNAKVHYRVHKTRYWSLSQARLIQSTSPHHITLRPVLMLSSHLLLGLCSGFFPSDFPSKILHASLVSLMRATLSAHLILLYSIVLIYLANSTSYEGAVP
jgi:hypothetical protein